MRNEFSPLAVRALHSQVVDLARSQLTGSTMLCWPLRPWLRGGCTALARAAGVSHSVRPSVLRQRGASHFCFSAKHRWNRPYLFENMVREALHFHQIIAFLSDYRIFVRLSGFKVANSAFVSHYYHIIKNKHSATKIISTFRHIIVTLSKRLGFCQIIQLSH